MMKQLNYMIGDWIGVSTSIADDGVESSCPAFEKIQYKLDGNIITIDLHSDALQLHTVIYYDETDKVYYYNPYYTSGAAKYPATFQEGKLIVTPNESKRFIFTSTPEGNFLEYGEKLVDGKWFMYFRDEFKRSK